MLQPIKVPGIPMSVVTEDMVKTYHGVEGWKSFDAYMSHQTCPHVEGMVLFYYSDYKRWLAGLPVID